MTRALAFQSRRGAEMSSLRTRFWESMIITEYILEETKRKYCSILMWHENSQLSFASQQSNSSRESDCCVYRYTCLRSSAKIACVYHRGAFRYLAGDNLYRTLWILSKTLNNGYSQWIVAMWKTALSIFFLRETDHSVPGSQGLILRTRFPHPPLRE